MTDIEEVVSNATRAATSAATYQATRAATATVALDTTHIDTYDTPFVAADFAFGEP